MNTANQLRKLLQTVQTFERIVERCHDIAAELDVFLPKHVTVVVSEYCLESVDIFCTMSVTNSEQLLINVSENEIVYSREKSGKNFNGKITHINEIESLILQTFGKRT
jgi:hypothetical protein